MIADLEILYVDDEPRLRHLVEAAFAESPVSARVHGVASGQEALAFIAGEDEHADAPKPDLVLLDKDLGPECGLDVLAELQADAGSESPVVMFTSSDDPTDVAMAYERGANAFVQKPGDFDGLVSFARGAASFWGPAGSVGASA